MRPLNIWIPRVPFERTLDRARARDRFRSSFAHLRSESRRALIRSIETSTRSEVSQARGSTRRSVAIA
ncbi:hypothetical protein DB32_004092 [Sandaracinus amylolyticus]|uniref:Uncharacterized protein n=1 Tax=Sandaracinus amylolyticus TaxID=927083 RepID=A0A0F6W414_9BACT|nr:hypothetical protein DB32_004092 [Sandaracinus amylolyticus]